MGNRSPGTPGGALGLAGVGRRSWLRALKWLIVLALFCLLIAIATELIPNGVNPSAVEAGGSSSSAKASSGAEAPDVPSGWGPEKSYLGRYHVLDATQRQAGGATTRLSGGELTMFMREVKKGKPLVPSGILNLTAPAPVGTELLYLTSLSSYATTHEAVVNGGAFVGPVVGSFAAVPTGGGRLTMTATVDGIGTIRATLVRFSSSPQP
jgi:hypothetical protein